MERRRRRFLALLAVALVGLASAVALLRRIAGSSQVAAVAPIVEGRPAGERREALERAAEATRSGREEARRELEALPPAR